MKTPAIQFRPYQQKAFSNRSHGIEVWLWGRQTGKSFTLAAWAVDRLLTRPGRLVTILSNSRVNGMELNAKCAQICEQMQKAYKQEDLSPDPTFNHMNMETRITVAGCTGRIKILASNPRTARGFSGDLILDEFAFHEDSHAIWDAAEPILTANSDYLCRVASTPNGKHNMFYHLVHTAGLPVRKVTRTEAWKSGCEIFHPVTRSRITPEQARENALDKKAYDQNFECAFSEGNLALLTYELIDRACDPAAGFICDEEWSEEALARIRACSSPLYLGVDVGRKHDITVITVLQIHNVPTVRGILRLRNMRLPQQQQRLAQVCSLPGFYLAKIDATGLGLGLAEFLQEKYRGKVSAVNFASSTTLDPRLAFSGSNKMTVRVPEALALQLLRAYEDNQIRHPLDPAMREDLCKPERGTTPSGRVTIAAARDEAGHADHFWSLALALDAARKSRSRSGGIYHQVVPRPPRFYF